MGCLKRFHGSESDPLSLGVSPLQKSTFCCSPPFSLKAAPAVAVGRSVQTWQSHLKFQAELANPKNLKGWRMMTKMTTRISISGNHSEFPFPFPDSDFGSGL